MPPLACALAIAGLDPSGGAGLAADLRAFAAAGAWGCAAVAVVTVQSTAGLRASRALEARELEAQVREVCRHQRVRAIKTGALGSAENVRVVERIAAHSRVPLVVDPVLGATRANGGARLLDRDALAAMIRLAGRATLVTPNVAEAEALLGARIANVEDAARAARGLVARGARAALVKGGHLRGREAVDVLAIGGRTLALRAPRDRGVEVHGTGCTLASLVAGRLAVGRGVLDDARLVEAVRWAKRRLTRSIGRAVRVGDGARVMSA